VDDDDRPPAFFRAVDVATSTLPARAAHRAASRAAAFVPARARDRASRAFAGVAAAAAVVFDDFPPRAPPADRVPVVATAAAEPFAFDPAFALPAALGRVADEPGRVAALGRVAAFGRAAEAFARPPAPADRPAALAAGFFAPPADFDDDADDGAARFAPAFPAADFFGVCLATADPSAPTGRGKTTRNCATPAPAGRESLV
jgi:hypothetical protein